MKKSDRYNTSHLIEDQYEPASQGRVARMLAALMALQAGLPPLDLREISGKGKEEYIKAVQAGWKKYLRLLSVGL
ncbi:MAG TPA: hypothetical protein ENG83_04770 [Nitrospirae bacterium]|nr:hypothetical protein BMS3Abin06_01849 [bacterium BMS3Abin06]HDH11502.1 hypothetical protein [Nitrospirota bacterium]HDZ01987.1 hypothetical protein [Nitrospirota bacterium]